MSRGLHLINEAADNVAAGIFDDRKSFFDGVIDVIKFIDIPSCAEAEASDQAWVGSFRQNGYGKLAGPCNAGVGIVIVIDVYKRQLL